MHAATELWAWICCPCRQDDADANVRTAMRIFVRIERTSATRLQIVLPRMPKIGTLLSAEVHGEEIVARVSATEFRPDLGWLTDCERLTPLMDRARSETNLTNAP